MGYHEIRSPISGIVAGRFIDPGDTSSAENPAFLVNRQERVKVAGAVPEAGFTKLRVGQAATVALDRLTPFPARVTAWSLAAEGGVDLTLEEEDAAVWDWNPAVDERATGSNPAVVLPNPGVIAAPALMADLGLRPMTMAAN